MGLRERLVDPRSPDHRPRRAAYALPTLFTAGNIFLGYISILRCIRGAMLASAGGAVAAGAAEQFGFAAKAIGAAFVLDGLDGRIARLTHTTSDFGREMDSLADVISFGMAPAVLALTWGVQFIDHGISETFSDQIHSAGYLIAFLFLICGAARLARFNIQKNPIPKNPGRPDRKYFVGMPIPAAAGMVAAVVIACDGQPLGWWVYSVAWLALVALLGFLMVSTWRYNSFKGFSLSKPYTTLLVVAAAGFIYLIWNYTRPVVLTLASVYVASGVVTRVAGSIRRRIRQARAQRAMERQLG